MFTTNQIKKLIAANRVDIFYNDRTWRRLSEEVKREQRNECQYCKRVGRVGDADVVHHVQHLRDYPDLAYSRFYTDENGIRQRQLVALCYRCHAEQHPEKKLHFRKKNKKEKYQNQERW